VDDIQLVNFIIALKDGLFGEQFQHDTPGRYPIICLSKNEMPSVGLPCTPHIHLRSINSRTKQQLWWTVPQGDHTICIIRSPSLLVKACKTKISKLEFTAVINKDIGTLDITVNYTLVMEVRQTSEHLMA